MTPKELKRLKRKDLLELLLEQKKQIETLQEELDYANAKLNDRMIAIDACGSIADASLQVNDVFLAAQAACDQYLENIRQRHARQDEICQDMERKTQEKCDFMIANAQQREQLARENCHALVADAQLQIEKTRLECDAMIAKAQQDADAYLEQAKDYVQQLLQQQSGLCQFLDWGQD